MLTIRQTLERSVSEAISRVTGIAECRAQVIYASRPEFGDYQANGVMAIARQVKTNPREMAQKVVDELINRPQLSGVGTEPLLARAEVAGPGFINLVLNDKVLSQRAAVFIEKPEIMTDTDSPAVRVVVDYSSPNLAKEMHVGHLRGTIIGDCIVRVLEASGQTVIRQNHVGDWGTQFGMLIAHVESMTTSGEELPRQLADLEAFYRTAKERFDKEPQFAETARSYVVRLQQGDGRCLQVWQQFIDESLHHCEEVYELLNVSLTRADLRPESFYNNELADIINKLDEKGLLTVSEGAKCVFLPEFTGKEGSPLPAIVQKSDGGYLYASTDLAALRFRSQALAADRILYVVDARQSLHFQQIFAIARKAGFVSDGCQLEHLAYGTMMGEDGRPFRTRSGDTVKLKDLLTEAIKRAFDLVTEKNPELIETQRQAIADKVGIAAVKYSELSKNRTSDYVFDWSSMLSFEGNTAPYMLYAYARIKSILRRSVAQSSSEGRLEHAAENGTVFPAQIKISAAEERALVLKILQFPETVQVVATECYPNYLCQYLYELAGTFMRFYEFCPILKAADSERASRLALAQLTAETLNRGLSLLGIETLEQM